MFTVEKMNGVWLVMEDTVNVVNAHARKRDAVSEASFLNSRKMVTRVNLMSGEEYQESIDTPLCCSPASETYWSM